MNSILATLVKITSSSFKDMRAFIEEACDAPSMAEGIWSTSVDFHGGTVEFRRRGRLVATSHLTNRWVGPASHVVVSGFHPFYGH